MAVADSTIAFSESEDISSITVEYGDASTITMRLVQAGTVSWEEGIQPSVLIRQLGKRLGTPQRRYTGDAMTVVRLEAQIDSWESSTAGGANPYNALDFTGAVASNTSVGNGDAKMVKLILTCDSTSAAGASGTGQSGVLTFNYAHCTAKSVSVNDGIYTCSYTLECDIAKPTFT